MNDLTDQIWDEMHPDQFRRDVDPVTDDVYEITICGRCGEEGHTQKGCDVDDSEFDGLTGPGNYQVGPDTYGPGRGMPMHRFTGKENR